MRNGFNHLAQMWEFHNLFHHGEYVSIGTAVCAPARADRTGN